MPKRVGENFWRGFVTGGGGPKRPMCERVVKSPGVTDEDLMMK